MIRGNYTPLRITANPEIPDAQYDDWSYSHHDAAQAGALA